MVFSVTINCPMPGLPTSPNVIRSMASLITPLYRAQFGLDINNEIASLERVSTSDSSLLRSSS